MPSTELRARIRLFDCAPRRPCSTSVCSATELRISIFASFKAPDAFWTAATASACSEKRAYQTSCDLFGSL